MANPPIELTYVDQTGKTTSIAVASVSVSGIAVAVVAPASPSGTMITAAGSGFVDSAQNTWSLVASASLGLRIAVNGTVDAVTQWVTQLGYVNGAIWQRNTAGNWYSKATAPGAPWVANGTTAPAPAATTPVTPIGGLPTNDLNGIQAVSVHSVCSLFGANAYLGQGASGQDGNDWRPAAIVPMLEYLVGTPGTASDTGHSFTLRNYVGGQNAMGSLEADILTVVAAMPRTRWNLSVNNYQGFEVSGVVYLATKYAKSGWIAYIEGLNEPNNSVFRVVPIADCISAQKAIYAAAYPLGIKVAGPSIISSGVDITSYVRSDGSDGVANMAALVGASDYVASHLYPNNGSANGASQFRDWTLGKSALWGDQGHPTSLSEFGGCLYNGGSHQSDAQNALYTVWALLAGAKSYNVVGMQFWSLMAYAGFDYSGLFSHGASTPMPVAKVMRCLFMALADTGATAATFAPGKLAISVTGLSADQFLVMQTSAGVYKVAIWNEQSLLTSAAIPVTVTFGGAMKSVLDQSVTNPIAEAPTTIAQYGPVASVKMNLIPEVRVLTITG